MGKYPWVYHRNGTISKTGILHLSLTCPMDNVEFYPFDEQECLIKWDMTPKLNKTVIFTGVTLDNLAVDWMVNSYSYSVEKQAYRFVWLVKI